MADTVYNDKMKKIFREANPQCDKKDCKVGDFHESEATFGNVICTGCMIQGENFGKPMVMPEDFKIPSR